MREKRSRETNPAFGQASVEAARSFEDLALRQLRANGFRITMPRVQVIRALGDSGQAMSAYAIHEKILNAGGKIDVVSVYRILGTLQEVGLIHHIGVADGYVPCRMDDANTGDSSHFVCEQTGFIEELEVPQTIKDALYEQAAEIGFIPTKIKIEVVGLSSKAIESQRRNNKAS